MDLIFLVLVLCIIGFVTWALTTRVPMDPMIRMAIQLLVFVVIILYVLRRFGFDVNFF